MSNELIVRAVENGQLVTLDRDMVIALVAGLKTQVKPIETPEHRRDLMRLMHARDWEEALVSRTITFELEID